MPFRKKSNIEPMIDQQYSGQLSKNEHAMGSLDLTAMLVNAQNTNMQNMQNKLNQQQNIYQPSSQDPAIPQQNPISAQLSALFLREKDAIEILDLSTDEATKLNALRSCMNDIVMMYMNIA